MIGQEKEFFAHGVRRRGIVVAYLEAGAGQVTFWIKTGDDQVHRYVDGPLQVADPLRVARDVLAGRRIHGMGVSEQLNVLAAAVIEAAEMDTPHMAAGGGA